MRYSSLPVSFLVLPFVGLLFICGGSSLSANETPQPSSDLLTSTIEKLLKVNVILTSLEADLLNQRRTVEELEQSLRQAAQRLADSEATLAEVEQRLNASEMLRRELDSSLGSLRDEYEKLRDSFLKLSTTFAEFRQEAERQIAKLEKSRNVWRCIAIGATAAAVLAFLGAIL